MHGQDRVKPPSLQFRRPYLFLRRPRAAGRGCGGTLCRGRGNAGAQAPPGVLPGPVRAHRRRRQWRYPTLFRLNALMIGAWLGFAVGFFVVVGTLSSVVGTLVVPRGIYSRISRMVDRALDAG